MMLADPGGAEAQGFRMDRLVDDIEDIGVGVAPIIDIMIVAQREVAEIHR